MTWRELLTEAGDRLRLAEVTEYELDAWLMFSEIFRMSRAEYFLHRDEQIETGRTGGTNGADSGRASEISERLERFRQMTELRSRHIPLQQLTGHQEFMGLDFLVNEHVLIPRQDTETLVEAVLRDLEGRSGEQRILDLCTGSGCIGISLERLAPVPVSVLGADISGEALSVARENSRRLNCTQFELCRSDLFDRIEGTFDLIVSNPPYIPSAVIETLDEEVRLHEPRLALDGESDGLAFYRRIVKESVRFLREGGRIYLEIGYDQGAAVRELLSAGGFSDIRIIRDLSGLDRVAAAAWRD